MLKLLILIYFILFNTCIANESNDSNIDKFVLYLNDMNITFPKEYDSLDESFCLKKGKIKVYEKDILHYSTEFLPFIFIHTKTEYPILEINYSQNFSLLLSRLNEDLIINKFDRLNIPHLILHTSDEDFNALYIQRTSEYQPISKDKDMTLAGIIKKVEMSSDSEIPVVFIYEKLSKLFRCSSIGDDYLRLSSVYMPVIVVIHKSNTKLIKNIFYSHIKSVKKYVSKIKRGIKKTITKDWILKKMLLLNLLINYDSHQQYLQLQ